MISGAQGHLGLSRRQVLWALMGTGVAVASGAFILPRVTNRGGEERGTLGYGTPRPLSDHNLPLMPTPACSDGRDEPTTAQIEGPFYSPRTPERTVLVEPGMNGIPLLVVGRVLTQDCRPIPGAVLDFWQADAHGRYDNTGSTLRGHQFADRRGQFRLDTIKPGAYGDWFFRRTPHIHVKVQGSRSRVLTTQLYFTGEPLNEQDGIFDPRLVMPVERRGDRMEAGFDFVLAET